MKPEDRLSKTINGLLVSRKDVEVPALLGNKSGTIKADNNGNVYVTFMDGETIIVQNKTVPNQRHWVIVGHKNDALHVLRSWDVFVSSALPDLPEHDHTWGKTSNPAWIRKEQIMDGLAVPGTGLTVEFYGFWFALNGTPHAIANQTIDLSAEIPTSGAQWCNVEADEDSLITFNAGTNKAAKELLLPEDIPATAADKRLLFSVKTYFGQTEFVKNLTENDFYDPRFSGAGSSASSAPATTAANDFQVGDGSGNWIKKTLAETKVILGIGDWVEATGAFTYASSTSMTTPSDLTGSIKKGMPLRWKQGGSYKYGNVLSITATTLNLIPNSVSAYAVANSAITDVAYSWSFAPLDFPDSFTFVLGWSSDSNPQPAFGNATLNMYYSVISRGLYSYAAQAIFGSTTTFGTGLWRFSLPAAVGKTTIGNTFGIDVSANAIYTGASIWDGTTKVLAILGTNYALPTFPFTWANGDYLGLSGTAPF